MPEAAGARQARAAFELAINHARLRPHRPGAIRIGRSENRDSRDSDRSRNMHASRIVADEPVAQRQQCDQLADIGVPGRDNRARFAGRRRPPRTSRAPTARQPARPRHLRAARANRSAHRSFPQAIPWPVRMRQRERSQRSDAQDACDSPRAIRTSARDAVHARRSQNHRRDRRRRPSYAPSRANSSPDARVTASGGGEAFSVSIEPRASATNPARRRTPAIVIHNADSKLFGNSTPRSNRRERISPTILRRSKNPESPRPTEYGITSSIHRAPSKKLASSFLMRTARCARGQARRIARSAGKLITTSPSQLTSLTRMRLGGGSSMTTGADAELARAPHDAEYFPIPGSRLPRS